MSYRTPPRQCLTLHAHLGAKKSAVDLGISHDRARQHHALHEIMIGLANMPGFDQFALGHHGDLVRPPDNTIRLTNYHPTWIEEQLAQRFFADDPVHAASVKLVRPFLWSELTEHLRMTDRQQTILERARLYGLHAGVTVPVRLPGEYKGRCSFATRDVANLHALALLLSQTAATFAFECARRLMRAHDGKAPDPIPAFTSKQREMLIPR